MNENVKIVVTECVGKLTGEPFIKTEYIGRATYIVDGREIIADVKETHDFGKKGMTTLYANYGALTEDGIPVGIINMQRAAGKVLMRNALRDRAAEQ